MRIDVISILPDIVEGFVSTGIIGRARRAGSLDIRVHDPRETTTDVHRTVDDSPFGGGAGMVLKPEPIFDIVESVAPPRPLIYMAPSGRPFTQSVAEELAAHDGFSLLCGRFEGVDERVRDHLVDDEISIGDYVLAGGEVAAAVIIEAVGRLVPGVLGNATSTVDESFSDGLLEYPHYTRPAEYRGWTVPDVLRSGDHGKVARWRRAMALAKTAEVRPDLLVARGGLTAADQQLLAEFDLST
jgi:tRNA (guanine37-N1)-methyltransferase